MNMLIEKKHIEEMRCGSNFSYILSDNSTFLPTEYKVLQSQANSCFVKCMKMMYNGKVQLYYLTNKYKPLENLLPALDPDIFMVICANLIADVLDVKSNGFLSCQNIDLALERIYVDTSTYKVYLIYLPIRQRIFDDNSSFENELRNQLVKLIQGRSSLSTPKTVQFADDLSKGSLSLEDLYTSTKSGKEPIEHNDVAKDDLSVRDVQMKLVALNAPTRVEIVITKNEFDIGQKADLVDGVIGFNKMISRSHCRVMKSGSQYFIIDLQSSNGTYVNHVRIRPYEQYPIKGGDIISLANSDFQVVIE